MTDPYDIQKFVGKARAKNKKLRQEIKRKQEEAWVKRIEKEFEKMEKAQKRGKNNVINGSELLSGDSTLAGSKQGPDGLPLGINGDNTFEYGETPGAPEYQTPGGPQNGQPDLVPSN